MRFLFLAVLLFAALDFFAQPIYTFECIGSSRLTGDSCDVCPTSIIQSRSFNGLLVYRDSLHYKWIDQPYSIRVKPGQILEYWEHGATPYSERITIPLSATAFFTVQGMADSTWCNSSAPQRFQELLLDSISTTLAKAKLTGSNTGIGIRAGPGISFDYQTDTLQISSSASVSANNGVSDNEAGGILRLGNRYMASPDAPFTMDRKVNVDGFKAYFGDTGDSTLFVINGATDKVGVNTDNPARDFSVTGEMRVSDLNTDTPDRVVGADSDGDFARVFLSGLTMSGGVLTAVDSTTTNEIQTYSHSGTTSYTNTLSLGGGSFTLNAAGILSISHTAGTVTLTATESQTANNGLSDNEAGGGIFRLGNRYMNGSDGLFSFDRKVNVNGSTLFIGDNTDSTLLAVFGGVDRVGINTTAASRTLHVNGEVRIADLVTDNPVNLVGTDLDGDLSEVVLGSGLSFSGTTLNVSAGSFYQTWRDDGTPATQRANANFVSTGRITTLLTDDAGNTETEVSFDVATNSIDNTRIRQGVSRSVVGVTGNATANVADIQSTGADLVLRTNGANTAIDFGQVATGGITNDAVTYAKIQNVAANNVLLGNDNGAGSDVQELTVAEVYTLLGLTGVANRFALWTGTNALGSDAAFTFDGANDRATFTGTVTGTGANTGILNLNTGALGAATTFLRMSGNVSSNMIAEIVNANNANAAANTIFTNSVGGANAGDPITQYNISGVVTHAFGIDNDDGDKMKLTLNGATPGANGNNGFTWSNTVPPRYGINLATPLFPLDVAGVARAEQYRNTGNLYTAANVAFGTGAGTGPTLVSIAGGNNCVEISFTTGTAPTANGNIFTITYPNAFGNNSIVARDAQNANASTDFTKFMSSTSNSNTFVVQANGTLTASTTYTLGYVIFGY